MRFVLGGLALLLMLVGCDGDTYTEAERRADRQAVLDAASEATDNVAEERYLDFMRDRIPGARSKSDSELLAGGRELCDELEGRTQDDLILLAAALGYDMQEFADAVVASVNTFCPEYDYLLES